MEKEPGFLDIVESLKNISETPSSAGAKVFATPTGRTPMNNPISGLVFLCFSS